MEQYTAERDIINFIFAILSRVVAEEDFTIDKLLKEKNSELTREILGEFYLKFNLSTKRQYNDTTCFRGKDCIRLRLRALFNLMAAGRDGMESYMNNVSTLLQSDPNDRFIYTRMYCGCHGTHTALQVVCMYSQMKRFLEHPIFTTIFINKLITTLSNKLREYAFKCHEEEFEMLMTFQNILLRVPLFGRIPIPRERNEERSVSPEATNPDYR